MIIIIIVNLQGLYPLLYVLKKQIISLAVIDRLEIRELVSLEVQFPGDT